MLVNDDHVNLAQSIARAAVKTLGTIQDQPVSNVNGVGEYIMVYGRSVLSANIPVGFLYSVLPERDADTVRYLSKIDREAVYNALDILVSETVTFANMAR